MRRRTFALTPIAVAIAAALPGTARADAPAAPAIPAPSGPEPVGHAAMRLVDTGRADPWKPDERRELMLSIWYPAKRPGRGPAQYVTAEESRMFLEGRNVQGLPLDILSTVRTNSTVDAPAHGGRHPLALLSPGFGAPRAELTGLAEELASHGYLVVGVGHNYETLGTTFPDGHTTPCLACGTEENLKLIEGRAADFTFVIDALTARHSPWRRLIDRDAIGLVGMSIGGAAAVPTLLTEPRVKAAVNLDGAYWHTTTAPIHRPLMAIGHPNKIPGAETMGWGRTWNQLTGWRRWVTVDGSVHGSFNDLPVLAEQAGLHLPGLDGAYALSLTRAYVRAFLDRHLRCESGALLDGPSPAWPEVRFHG
ncbi:esterase [Actinorhabdospora filicis]|uniref:Esterase n=1 Tax=Actinorhabdospora filicis TaxID=1785913 RepID=A0A9W6W4V6_9ACTN|nr:hypothetical protein [Actinorhabdospora filicis]GLZ79687.1 esterase [Actinorhabdospora filicis]